MAAAAWSQRSCRPGRRHPPQASEDANEPVCQVHLAELGHLLAELPLALLRPDREEVLRRERAEPLDDRAGGHLDDSTEPGPVDRNEGIAEIERDGVDGREVHPGHVATLDGQISRNGQYEQAMRSGLAV